MCLLLLCCFAQARAAVLTFTEDWRQQVNAFQGRPAFGSFRTVGTNQTDWRFCASAGEIKDTDVITGVLRTFARATQENILPGDLSQGQGWVQFSRPFSLSERARETVSTSPIGTLEVEDSSGQVLVF